MTETQIQLLREIGNGRTSFQRDEPSDAGTVRLQMVLEQLEGIASQDYIEILKPHHESWSGQRNLDTVRVRLTPAGQQWLEEHPPSNQSGRTKDDVKNSSSRRYAY
jgi:hypothetical protein